MKNIVFAAVLLFFSLCPAQESATDPKAEVFVLNGSATYELHSELYTFVPDANGIKITKVEHKEDLDFGQLRKATDDGLYVMTFIETDELAFGRFDSIGNFKTLRYDPLIDTVLEKYFKRTQPGSKK
jgi:hypothetical protein